MSSTKVFDPNVFDWSFATMDIIPSINKVLMARSFQKLEAGSSTFITVNFQDIMTTIGEQFDMDPTPYPQIQIYNPDGTVKVAYTNMVFVGRTGFYGYQYQTSSVDQIGVYTGQIKASVGAVNAVSDKLALFQLTKP